MPAKQKKKVAYLGPQGTFSEEAVASYLAGTEASALACNSFEEICRGIREGRWEEGLIPVENSSEGTVGQAMDLLAECGDLKIRGEILLPVKHSLLAPPGVTVADVEVVVSHPQALGQCRRFLAQKLPGAATREAASTAHAAGEVACAGRPWAALASPLAAKIYGLEVLMGDISDCRDNTTRFLVLGREEVPFSGASKTTVILRLSDRPGALYGILGEFAYRNINLTRIESRPAKKKLGEYIFFIDLEGHREQPVIADAINEVSRKCITCRVAGSYPAARQSTGTCTVGSSVAILRRQIDEVDREIIALLGRRAALTDKIARFKSPGKVRDREREREILTKAMAEAKDKGLDPMTIKTIFEIILANSVHRQGKLVEKKVPLSSNQH